MSLFGGGGGAFGGGAGGGGFGANNNLGQQNTQNPNTNGSYMITQPELQDGISCMAWSTNDALAAGSWDCSVTVWSVQSQAQVRHTYSITSTCAAAKYLFYLELDLLMFTHFHLQ